MSINLNDIAILNIHEVTYRCIINGISKGEVVNLPQNADLTEKVRHYRLKKFLGIKVDKKTIMALW